MSKKDTDLARLRGQRDEYGAELSERKARDAEKARYAEEMEALCNARQERINFLSSEVKRLRGTLAARDGAESYLAFLRTDADIDADYIKTLEAQLASAKEQVDALSAQLSTQANGHDSASDAAAIRSELEAARRSLAKYERVLGPDAPEDVAQLTARLQKESEAKAKLELQLTDAEETTNSLYAELEGVTKLWEGLDHTLRTKVFELKDGELRMQRLCTEKAKADNKYFQAMRSKEAVDAECKTAQRSVEKQLKLLERAREVEKALLAQIVSRLVFTSYYLIFQCYILICCPSGFRLTCSHNKRKASRSPKTPASSSRPNSQPLRPRNVSSNSACSRRRLPSPRRSRSRKRALLRPRRTRTHAARSRTSCRRRRGSCSSSRRSRRR